MPPTRTPKVPFTVHAVSGPGLWVTFVRGRDHQAARELLDVFEDLALEIWPESTADGAESSAVPKQSIEDELAEELAALKKAAKKTTKHDKRFNVVHTDVECLMFVICKPPIDVYTLVQTYFERVERTKVTGFRYIQRVFPIETVYSASMDQIESQAHKLWQRLPSTATKFKVEAHLRNHASLDRDEVIRKVVDCLDKSPGHVADLKNPDYVAYVMIFKSVSMMGLFNNYQRFCKYNPHQISIKAQSMDSAEPSATTSTSKPANNEDE
ncbi:hypothetical protein BKA62DRAFT_698905 [Auriculariales sp. MPI-PUGE-AT-0066]|nr:hypothetical protein BKA62DRAFT_698905 [Auriculariales sp. MPI-PUGE-AT-0066]